MMETIREGIQVAWEAMTTLEIIAVVLALVYVVLAAREHIACWPAALGSSLIYLYLLLQADLYLESGLQIFYALMAVVGWWAWTHTPASQDAETRPVTMMTGREHLLSLLMGASFTLGMGYYFSTYTEAAMPYWDAFTTGFALLTTYWVTMKKLENWLYWVVIDAVSIYLYFSRELYLSGVLFLVYTIIAVVGYFQWRRAYLAQAEA